MLAFSKSYGDRKRRGFFFPPSYFLLHLLFSFFFCKRPGFKALFASVPMGVLASAAQFFLWIQIGQGRQILRMQLTTLFKVLYKCHRDSQYSLILCPPGKLNHLERWEAWNLWQIKKHSVQPFNGAYLMFYLGCAFKGSLSQSTLCSQGWAEWAPFVRMRMKYMINCTQRCRIRWTKHISENTNLNYSVALRCSCRLNI